MPAYRKILVTIDLNPEDDNPLKEKAKKIADAFDAEIFIVHAVPPMTTHGIPPGSESNVEEWQYTLEETAQKNLRKVGEDLSVPVDKQFVEVGTVKNAILNCANKIKADLIVMGTHHRTGIVAFFTGGTAEDVLHDANCDILAVDVSKKSS